MPSDENQKRSTSPAFTNPDEGFNLPKLLRRLRLIFAPWSALPFNFRGTIVNYQRWGGNGYVAIGVSCAAAGSVTINHPSFFNRTPVGALLLDNGTTATTNWTITARSSTSITISPVGALSNATIAVF